VGATLELRGRNGTAPGAPWHRGRRPAARGAAQAEPLAKFATRLERDLARSHVQVPVDGALGLSPPPPMMRLRPVPPVSTLASPTRMSLPMLPVTFWMLLMPPATPVAVPATAHFTLVL
jgi:hypothetical protein